MRARICSCESKTDRLGLLNSEVICAEELAKSFLLLAMQGLIERKTFACVPRGATYYASSSLRSMRRCPNMRTLILFLALALAAFIAPANAQSPAQSTAIQPCEATPSPPKPGAPLKAGVRSAQTVVDATIPDDPDVEKMLAPYSGKVRALSAIIAKLDQPLKKESVGAGPLGNFVTNGIRSFAKTKLNKP